MLYFIPLIYVAAGAYLLYRGTAIRSDKVSGVYLSLVFLCKVLMSVVYTIMHYQYYGGADTANYYDDSMIIYRTLWENPWKYLLLTFGPNNLSRIPSLIAQEVEAMGFWYDTGSYSVVRFYAISNLLSGGNIYVAGILMSFITTIALARLYEVVECLVENRCMALIITFGLPSVMFWTSGVHKEGLVITGLCVLVFAWYRLIEKKVIDVTSMLGLVLSAMLLGCVRHFMLFLLIPGAVAYLITHWFFRARIIWVYVVIYLLFIIMTMQMTFVMKNERFQIASAIRFKQLQFMHSSKGNTDIPIDLIEEENPLSLVKLAPKALLRSVFTCFYFNPSRISHWLFWVENVVIMLLLGYYILQWSRCGMEFMPLASWLLLFSVSYLILIGWTVPNGGAIIRYRSIILPMLLSGMAGWLKKG